MSPVYRQLSEALATRYTAGEARAVAFLVLETAFGMSRTEVYAGKVRNFSAEEQKHFGNILQRLVDGEPVQYVLGTADFCGRPFRVTPDTLIPRPETEELVALALDAAGRLRTAGDHSLRLLDAGTGSGCIAVTLALGLPAADVEAWDISAAALDVAAGNAAALGARVRFVRHDLLATEADTGGDSADADRFDLIVSNPPYVCDSERTDMEQHVLEHEPHTALFVPDDDPLLFYRALATLGRKRLAPGGALLVEINRAYGPATAALLRSAGYTDVRLHRDAFGADRMVEAWQPA